MTTYLHRVIKLVKHSGQLSEPELVEFTAALLWADDQELSSVLRFISQYPYSIRWLFENLKAKQEALKFQDQNAWDQILKQEVAWMESLSGRSQTV